MFTSIETIDLENTVRVSDSKALEPFLKEKLFVSIYESLKHKPEPLKDARDLTETICAQVMRQHIDRAVIKKQTLVTVSADILQRYDEIAGKYYRARFTG